jgi:serine/threonine protein kinase
VKPLQYSSSSSSSSSSLPTQPERDWASMPHYPVTLDNFSRPLDKTDSSKLISQMLTALNFLHNNKLVHMDLKPANIFIDSNGNFFLGDFGSVRKIGDSIGSTTLAFLPSDLKIETNVTIQHDYWMLGMTIKDMSSTTIIGEVGVGAKYPNKIDVINAIIEIGTHEANLLIQKINT